MLKFFTSWWYLFIALLLNVLAVALDIKFGGPVMLAVNMLCAFYLAYRLANYKEIK